MGKLSNLHWNKKPTQSYLYGEKYINIHKPIKKIALQFI